MKTPLTRIAAIVIVFFAVATTDYAQSKEHTTYSIIDIKYVGPHKYPCEAVLISDSEAGVERYHQKVWAAQPRGSGFCFDDVHVTNASFLEKLITRADAFENSRQRYAKNPVPSESAVIQVSIVTPKRNNSFLYEMEEAQSLLEVMRKTCSKDEALSEKIARFRDWIRQRFSALTGD